MTSVSLAFVFTVSCILIFLKKSFLFLLFFSFFIIFLRGKKEKNLFSKKKNLFNFVLFSCFLCFIDFKKGKKKSLFQKYLTVAAGRKFIS